MSSGGDGDTSGSPQEGLFRTRYVRARRTGSSNPKAKTNAEPMLNATALLAILLSPSPALSEEPQVESTPDDGISSILDLQDESAMVANSVSASYSLGNVAAMLGDTTVSFYGYIKADVVTSTGKFNSNDFAKNVVQGGSDDSQFSIHARQTRLGFKVKGPEGGNITTSARFEADFFSGAAANSSNPRMRHAYVNLACADSNSSLLIGQTSDVVSPLTTPTVNYNVLWWSGDMGFRRNQLRYTKKFDMGDDSSLTAIAALTRSIGGEDTGNPGYQGRLAYTFAGMGEKPSTVGVSAHSARIAAGGESDSVAIDMTFPLNKTTTIKGEFFSGNNLAQYLGGAGQNGAAGADLESTGYWLSVSHKANAKTTVNVGFGQDDPEDDDIGANDISENSTLFANVMHSLNSATSLGFEVAQHDTGYKGAADEDATRVQFSATFSF